MKREWTRTAISYITVVCFVTMTTAAPTIAYAQDEPEELIAEVVVPSIPPLTPISELKLTYTPPAISFCPNCTITPLLKDIPFTPITDGIFLPQLTASTLLAQQQYVLDIHTLERDRSMQLVRASDILYIRTLEGQLATERQMNQIRLTEVTTQRDIFAEKSLRSWYEKPEFLVPVGVILGIGLTLATGAIISETWEQ